MALHNALGEAAPVGLTREGKSVLADEVALDGANPTAVTTPFKTIDAVQVSLKGSAAPGVGTSIITYDVAGAVVNFYAWKVTGTGDTTLIASAGTETISYAIYGRYF